ncbi:LEAF RUST 10 DISEASE-RESISTANCE LOCUS RECEPTOR-LIKE PROTEIN KINASE-like 2.4 [Coffea eugenioides]|uniref:LEAF RUST 10 DISEASE-RESISTANCE LOCUS RECEPTOR-LIKE PROTEIN KINASE-like 2.4 n=1 Tax=Coffea eugenioides TaxID=49369 RepID=UPI000F60D2A4|nr:LEAF RUST 10 DISEASE-RESISTANCE LOCUS RECEPTOR-LIKE PROTEIN KINASE-like 2.4 [Coffea eugenioides]
MPFTLTLIQSLLVTPVICFAFFALSFCDGVAPTATTFINCDKTFNCGSITNVTFPFTGGDRPDHCGLPEFRLTCQQPNNVAELTHNSVTYRVLQLDQTLKRLTLSRSDLYNNTCLSHFTNSTLNSTFFSIGDLDDDALSIIYRCNSSAMSIKPQNLFSCSIPGVNFTDAYYIVGPIPSDPILRFINCSVSVTVPILRSAGARLVSNEISLSEAVMQVLA